MADRKVKNTRNQSDESARDLAERWQEFIANADAISPDVNALLQQVLRESYAEANKDLQFFADKVKFFNQQKKAIRDELTKARYWLAQHVESGDCASADDRVKAYVPLRFENYPTLDEDCNPQVAWSEGDPLNTRGKFEAYLAGLENTLATVGDDAQLANIDLQNLLQNRQQTVQMMSNVSKTMHDTAMAIIRKMGG